MKPIFRFQNKDKDHWQKNDDAQCGGCFRMGGRVLITGPPNAGKTNCIFNLICDSTPAYDIIYLYQASKDSKEYSMINYTPLETINDLPEIEDIPKDKKILVILEDMDTVTRLELKKLDVWFRFVASHLGVCIVVAAQNFFSIPVILRRKIDCFILFLFGMDDLILKHIPIHKDDKKYIMNYFKKNGDRHSFITIDLAIKDKYIFNNEVVLNI